MVCVTVIYGADPKLTELRLPIGIALPFKDEKKRIAPDSYTNTEVDEDEEDDNAEEEQEPLADSRPFRISTRARLAYDLSRYDKNAMLLFNATDGYTREDTDRISDRMAIVTETFHGFRFEIETYDNLTNDQIAETCERFFQRDFSDYGCVAVVVLTFDGVFEDYTVTRHWVMGGNPTLQHKPKLYVNEASRMFHFRRSNLIRFSRPIEENCPDVISLSLPALFHHLDDDQPIKTFCDKLKEMADLDHMMTIVKEAIKEMKPRFRSMIYVYSTLEKQMFLYRTESVVTRL